MYLKLTRSSDNTQIVVNMDHIIYITASTSPGKTVLAIRLGVWGPENIIEVNEQCERIAGFLDSKKV